MRAQLPSAVRQQLLLAPPALLVGGLGVLQRTARCSYIECDIPLSRTPLAPQDILTTTGCLDCSPPSGAAGTPHGHSCFEGALASARQHGLAHEVLSAAQVNARFPGYSLPEGFQVDARTWQCTGGNTQNNTQRNTQAQPAA